MDASPPRGRHRLGEGGSRLGTTLPRLNLKVAQHGARIMAAFARKKRITWIGILLVLCCLAFASSDLQSADPSPEATVPTDWVKVSVSDRFHLKAPPGTKFEPKKGIDSYLGLISAPRFTLEFDYGAYSDPLDPGPHFGRYRSRETRIDGKSAKIVTAYGPNISKQRPYFIGVHFPNIGESPVGSRRLTMFGWFEDPGGYGTAETVFRTIEFP